jgi:hypothetical protein
MTKGISSKNLPDATHVAFLIGTQINQRGVCYPRGVPDRNANSISAALLPTLLYCRNAKTKRRQPTSLNTFSANLPEKARQPS